MRKVIGLDFGGINLVAGVVREDGKVVLRHPGMKTRAQRPGEEIARDIAKIAAELYHRYPDAVAVGVGSPGIVRPSGVYGFAPCNCPNWGRANIKRTIEGKLPIPCFVNNDAQVFAAGERKWGAGQGAKFMLMLTLGTGIGGGLPYMGQDFQGVRNTIEIGHMCVDFTPNAGLCGCGKRGCAEAYASNTGIARQAREAVENGILPKPKRGQEIDAKWVYALAREGHAEAAAIVSRAHAALATLIANFANTISIDVCVLAGGITKVGDYLFDDIRRRVNARLLPTAKVDIRPASLGKDFSIQGAAAYALDILGA